MDTDSSLKLGERMKYQVTCGGQLAGQRICVGNVYWHLLYPPDG